MYENGVIVTVRKFILWLWDLELVLSIWPFEWLDATQTKQQHQSLVRDTLTSVSSYEHNHDKATRVKPDLLFEQYLCHLIPLAAMTVTGARTSSLWGRSFRAIPVTTRTPSIILVSVSSGILNMSRKGYDSSLSVEL